MAGRRNDTEHVGCPLLMENHRGALTNEGSVETVYRNNGRADRTRIGIGSLPFCAPKSREPLWVPPAVESVQVVCGTNRFGERGNEKEGYLAASKCLPLVDKF